MVTKSRKKQAKQSSTFLKDPLESIAVHIGNIFNNANPNMLVDVGINLGLAWLGCDTFGYKPESALLGPVSLRLAQSDNLASGTAGAIGLAGLGVCRVAPDLLGTVQDWVDSLGVDVDAVVSDHMMQNYGLTPDKYDHYYTVTILERCPDTGQDGKHIEIGYGMGLLAKACVFIPSTSLPEPEPPPEPPPEPEPEPEPEPPLEGWTRTFTQDRMICSTHLPCGTTVCAWNNADLLSFMQGHACPSPNGVE